MSTITTISRGGLTASIDSMGAQLTSLALNGNEYLWQADPVELFPFMHQHYRAVCYGLWCARQLHEPLPKGFWKDERLQKLLGWCAANRIHIAYWLPLRLRWRRMAEQMYVWSQLHDANFGHFDWLFYYIEGAKKWKRPDTL